MPEAEITLWMNGLADSIVFGMVKSVEITILS
jgi:hypothetical protein